MKQATIIRPAVPVTDKAFQYTPSHQTDLAKKFRQVIRAQQRNPQQVQQQQAEALHEKA